MEIIIPAKTKSRFFFLALTNEESAGPFREQNSAVFLSEFRLCETKFRFRRTRLRISVDVDGGAARSSSEIYLLAKFTQAAECNAAGKPKVFSFAEQKDIERNRWKTAIENIDDRRDRRLRKK